MSEGLVCFRKYTFVWLGGEAHNAVRVRRHANVESKAVRFAVCRSKYALIWYELKLTTSQDHLTI